MLGTFAVRSPPDTGRCLWKRRNRHPLSAPLLQRACLGCRLFTWAGTLGCLEPRLRAGRKTWLLGQTQTPDPRSGVLFENYNLRVTRPSARLACDLSSERWSGPFSACSPLGLVFLSFVGSSCLVLRWLCVFLQMGAQEARSCCFSDWGFPGWGAISPPFRPFCAWAPGVGDWVRARMGRAGEVGRGAQEGGHRGLRGGGRSDGRDPS